MALSHAYKGLSASALSQSDASALVGLNVYGTLGTGFCTVLIDGISTPMTLVPASPEPQDGFLMFAPDRGTQGLSCGVYSVTLVGAGTEVILWFRPKAS